MKRSMAAFEPGFTLESTVHDERRDDVHALRVRELGLLVDVYLGHGDAVAVLLCYLLVHGPEPAAVAAPGRPEVHQHGLIPARHLSELLPVYLNSRHICQLLSFVWAQYTQKTGPFP